MTRATCLTAVLLCAAACTRTRPGVQVDQALLDLVPADTVTLVGVQMDKMRETPLYKKLAAEQRIPRLDDFTRETGLDPRTDIREVLLASNKKDNLALVRGRFAVSELEAKIEKQGGRRMPHKGRTLFGNEQGAVVFLNSSTALAGRTAQLRALLDGPKGRPPQALLDKLTLIPASNQVWAASLDVDGTLPLPGAANLPNLKNMPLKVESLIAGAEMGSGLKAFAEGLCDNEVSAKRLHDAGRGLIGFGRLSAPDNRPELLRLYDTVQVEQKERTIRVAADVPAELVDQILKLLNR
jgi:hypothetical protein